MAFVTEIEHESPEIISLSIARKQLQLEVDFTEDDQLIQLYIDAAIGDAEAVINSAILEVKERVEGKSFADVLKYSNQKIQSIDLVKYKDLEGVSKTIEATNYSLERVDKYENKIVFNEDFVFPEVKQFDSKAVTIEVTLGYADGKVPKKMQSALLLKITEKYENRFNSVKEKSTEFENILHSYRRY